MRTLILITCFLAAAPGTGWSGDRDFRLSSPDALQQSGLLQFILPRFSLKTQTRVEIVGADVESDLILGGDGRAIFTGLGQTWRMQPQSDTHPGVDRFTSWVTSEIGQRTISSYAVDGVQMFTLPTPETVHTAAVEFDGDAAAGREISRVSCGRCHVVDANNRMNAIGSTPSFFVLRSLPDWEDRFSAFFALNPHPAFTQIDGLTPPFPSDRPSPIVPLEMTLSDLEAVIAFVSGLAPADLGAPLQHQ